MAVIFKGKARQFEREHDQRMSLAWHTAALPRAEKFPDLSSLLIVPPPSRVVKAQSETESWNTFVALKARMENS